MLSYKHKNITLRCKERNERKEASMTTIIEITETTPLLPAASGAPVVKNPDQGTLPQRISDRVCAIFKFLLTPFFTANSPYSKTYQACPSPSSLTLTEKQKTRQLDLIREMLHPDQPPTPLQTIGQVVKDIFVNIFAFFGGDAMCGVRRFFNVAPPAVMAAADAAKTADALAAGAIGASLVQGGVQIALGVQQTVEACHKDNEGVDFGLNLIVQGIFNIVAGVLWAVVYWSAVFAATTAGILIGTVACPLLFAASCLFNLVLAVKKLINLIEFNKEFRKCFTKTASGEEVVDEGKLQAFIQKCLLITEGDEKKIDDEAKVYCKKMILKNHPEVVVSKSGPVFTEEFTQVRFDDEVQKMLGRVKEALRKTTLETKKAYLERRLNSECYEKMHQYLAGTATFKAEQLARKITNTIWWNRFFTVVKIVILVAGIAALIALTICPAGHLAIFLVLFITLLCWVILDLRGCALWPKIRRHLFGDETEDEEPSRKQKKVTQGPAIPRTCS